jgi:HAD superfamily hydrolase (TIGR01509 family)
VPDDHDWERIFLGRPDRDGLADWFAEYRVVADVEELMAAKQARIAARLATEVTACDDGQWLARELHRRGVPLALVTGARRTEATLVIARFALDGVFAATVSADDVVVGKPDPEPYLRGAAALGVPASACLVIEDAVPGLRAAEAAGAAVIVVDRLGQPDRFAPVQPVERLDERVLAAILGG